MVTAKDVSDFFLQLSEPEVGDILSNLKIQKLVYYAQGLSLALNNKPLFEDEILAWEHGPVVENLYHQYKEYGANPIPLPQDFDINKFSPEEIELLKEVYDVYGQFSAWKLRNMTHAERPWLETQRNNIITKDLLKEYFLTQIN